MNITEKLDEIERGLEGVTPGPWEPGIAGDYPPDSKHGIDFTPIHAPSWGAFVSVVTSTDNGGGRVGTTAEGLANLDHIARLDPATVRELVSLARSARSGEAVDPDGVWVGPGPNAPPPSVPTGYKLVPEEPTEEMLLAAYKQSVASLLNDAGNAHCKTDEERSAHTVRPLYRTMIAAAPPAPASQERGEVPEPVAFLGPDGLPSPPLRFPQPWRDDPARCGLIPLYEHPPLTATPSPSRREALEEAVAAIEAERARWTATAPFGQGRASGFSKAIEAVRALIPSEGK